MVIAPGGRVTWSHIAAGRKRQRIARGDPRGGAGDRLTAEQAVVAPFAGTVIAIAHEPDEPVGARRRR